MVNWFDEIFRKLRQSVSRSLAEPGETCNQVNIIVTKICFELLFCDDNVEKKKIGEKIREAEEDRVKIGSIEARKIYERKKTKSFEIGKN